MVFVIIFRNLQILEYKKVLSKPVTILNKALVRLTNDEPTKKIDCLTRLKLVLPQDQSYRDLMLVLSWSRGI